VPPPQGTTADLTKLAMIRIDRDLKQRCLASRMLLQVHDELLFGSPHRRTRCGPLAGKGRDGEPTRSLCRWSPISAPATTGATPGSAPAVHRS
jgi:hypothetical protein